MAMIKQWIVSAFTLVSWRSGKMEIISTSSGITLTIDDTRLICLIHAFANPRTIEEVVNELVASIEQPQHHIDNLIRAGVLVPASECEEATLHHWNWSALAYHRQSRRPDFQKPHEPTVPIAALRSVKNWIPLIRGAGQSGRDFADVLEARRSWRMWAAVTISYETFSGFLWLSARNRGMPGYEIQIKYLSRPYPSGGAIYSLDLYLVIAEYAVEGITAGLYKYLPECHGLEPISIRSTDFLPFLESAGRSAGTTIPPVVVLITSRFGSQSVAYGDLAYSLLLKEVGCLFQTMYLVGEYLKLRPCALGGGAPGALLANLCNDSDLAAPLIGEFMLGPA